MRWALLALLVVAGARAHEKAPQRRVLVSAEPAALRLVVSYQLPTGREAQQLRLLTDAGGKLHPLQRLARLQVLVPNALRGLALAVDGVPVTPQLVDARSRDLSPEGARTGHEVLVLLEAPWTVEGEREVVLLVGDTPTLVEMQVDGLRRVGTSLPTRPEDPVAGPRRMESGAATLRVAPNR